MYVDLTRTSVGFIAQKYEAKAHKKYNAMTIEIFDFIASLKYLNRVDSKNINVRDVAFNKLNKNNLQEFTSKTLSLGNVKSEKK